jgi:hypothetical protein
LGCRIAAWNLNDLTLDDSALPNYDSSIMSNSIVEAVFGMIVAEMLILRVIRVINGASIASLMKVYHLEQTVIWIWLTAVNVTLAIDYASMFLWIYSGISGLLTVYSIVNPRDWPHQNPTDQRDKSSDVK